MNLLISIDDTDNQESPGSGQLAENLANELQKHGLAECSGISRHQLFVHEKIPYTAHNSAMCFTAVSQADDPDEIIRFGQSFLRNESAIGADPGLCVTISDCRLNRQVLIDFGMSAKKSILTKQNAYELAQALGIHLSEHGGTGGGVIGALAAIGLRLQGNDGRFRGWYHFGQAGEITTAAWVCAHAAVDAVVTEEGVALEANTPIILAENRVKSVLLGGQQVVPVARMANASRGAMWSTLTKAQVKRY